MGRNTCAGSATKTYKMRLYYVKLDGGGYDDGGAYWGFDNGNRLYCLESECGGVIMFLRAHARCSAKVKALKLYPKAKFFR